MAEDLDALETWIGGLIAKLKPAERVRLAKAISVDLRRGQVKRIADQLNPDGARYTPRKRAPLRGKTGRVRKRAGDMFRKLRGSTYLGVRATADEANVGFANAQVSRIAQVHQDGLRDKVSRAPDAPEVDYPVRVLLGHNDESRQRVLDLVLKHLEI